MISRSVVWGWLLCLLVRVGQPIQYVPQGHLAPPPAAVGPGDCALILGNDRSSLYDYGTNLLRGTLDIEGSAPCITYDAINQAYIEARKRIHVQVPPVERMWKTDEIAKVGELLLDITAQLAKTYGLSVEDIETGLPQIDTSKTLIQEVCPPYLSSVECHAGKYRRLDGLCNNINNPSWGATMTPFSRLVPPQFADGLNAPRSSVLGHNLPLPRVVSRTMHPDDGFHDHAGTVMVVAWGQFMDHDFTLTATPLDPVNKNDPEECCDRPPHLKHPYCLEIIIPDDDYFFKGYKVKCMDFVRSFPSVRPGCRLGSKVPYNTLTGVIDGNTIYGVDDEFGRHLRSGYGGELRMNPVFAEYGLKDLLPLKLDVPDEGCTRTNSSQFCFESGEIRVNEQLVLTCMHTLMAREHNRVARGLAEINPHWDDETLYQESRRIVIAEIQHITFNEFLPIILGKDVMEKFGLMLQKEGYWDGYEPTVNPNIIAAFSAAAFRFGHSLLPTAVERWSKAHKFISSKRLSDLIRRPYDLYRAGVMDEYLMGLMNQVAQAMDDSITQEVTNHLLKKPGNRFGLDLVAFNMQRGREFGVPGYMQYRKFCGLPTADSFEELFGSMPNSTVYRYSSIFDHPNDIDLWSGGVSERPLPGSMLGPTFACIIATQLSFNRRGDRFWYELPNQPSSFTPEQLQEIRKVKLSRVICDNTDLIDTIQIYPMVLPDHQINPRVPCKAGIIPSLDLTKWAEFPNPAHYNLSKPSQPQSSIEEIVVVCNGTAGCSVPGLDSLVDKTISSLDNFIKGEEAEKPGSSKIIDIFAESPVLYIQRLKRWFQEQGLLDNQTVRVRRTKRETLVKIPFRQSLKAEGGSENYNLSVQVSNKTFLPRLQNVSDLVYVYPENRLIRNRKKRNIIQFELPEGVSKKVKISFLNNYDAQKTSVAEDDLIPRISRSDGDIEESQSDFKKTKQIRKRPALSAFTGPVNLPSQRRWGDDPGFNQQLLLAGSVRDYSTGNQNDPTNNFQILDADHDYDNEYEFVKINKHESDGPEEEESRDSSGGSNESRQSYEGERNGEEGSQEGSREGSSNEEGSREGEEEEDNAGEKENSEEEEDVEKTKIVVLQPTAAKVPQSFQFGLSDEDIQARYITKDPLAGPGATRGFNHDFKAARGVPIQGGISVLPNTRYPTIPGFKTKQIHNILTSGKLPGTVGVGPNGTTIGIIPIEPARHARPNNLGQYLEEIHPPLMSPGRGVHPRRPVGRIRIKSQIHKGMPRRPVYSMAPIRGQQLVYVNRPPRYRQPVRGGTHLSYQGRGNPANMYRSRASGRPMMIVKRVERRGFAEEQPEDYVGDVYISNPKIGYSSRGHNNKPPDNYNQEIVSLPKPSPSDIDITKTKPFIEDDEYKRSQNKKNKNNIPNWPFSKIGQNEDGNGNVHDTENTPNEYFRGISKEEKLRDNNEEENKDEDNPNANKKINHNLPNWSVSKIGQNEDGNENVHNTENTRNEYLRRKSYEENLRNNNEEENTDEDNLQEEDVKGKAISDVPLTSRPEEVVEKLINEQGDLQKSIAKIMQRTKELENEKLTTDGEEPAAYNKYWSLEYSYPT